MILNHTLVLVDFLRNPLYAAVFIVLDLFLLFLECSQGSFCLIYSILMLAFYFFFIDCVSTIPPHSFCLNVVGYQWFLQFKNCTF